MKEITSQELIDRVLLADPNELNDVMDAVTERFTEIWPEWELMIMSIHGHTPEAHLETLDRTRAVYERILSRERKLEVLPFTKK